MFGLKMNDSELKGRKIRVYKARSQDEVSSGGNYFFTHFYIGSG